MGYYESVVVRGKLRPAHRLIGAAWRWILPAAAALFMILGLLGMHSIAPHAGDSTEPQAKHSKVVDTGHAGGTAQAASGTDACASCGDHAPDGGMALMCGMILWQTSEIVNGGETNYVLATVGLYVSLYNLFTSLLHLLGAFMGERD